MMETKFTKGEWEHAIEKEGMNINDVIKHNNQYIATIHVTGTTEEWKANAKLIAAAPDLLEALIALEKAIPNDGTWNYQSASDAARKAILKATE